MQGWKRVECQGMREGKAALNHRVAVFEIERMRIYFVTASYLEWKERTDLEPVSASDQLHFLPLIDPMW